MQLVTTAFYFEDELEKYDDKTLADEALEQCGKFHIGKLVVNGWGTHTQRLMTLARLEGVPIHLIEPNPKKGSLKLLHNAIDLIRASEHIVAVHLNRGRLDPTPKHPRGEEILPQVVRNIQFQARIMRRDLTRVKVTPK